MLRDRLSQEISSAIGALNPSQYVGVGGAVRLVVISGETTIITAWLEKWQSEEINTAACNVVANEILRLITLYRVEEDMVLPVVGITLQISKRCVEVVIKLRLTFKEQQDSFGDGEQELNSIPYYDFELEYGGLNDLS